MVFANKPSHEVARWFGVALLGIFVAGGALLLAVASDQDARAEATAACPTVEAS